MAVESEVVTASRILFADVPATPLGRLHLAATIADSPGVGEPRIYGKYAAVLLLRGGGRYRDLAGYRTDVSAGDLILVFPELAHQYGPGPGQRWDELYLVFDGPVFDLLRRTGVLDATRPVSSGRPREWRSRLMEFAHRPPRLDRAGGCADVADFVSLLAHAGMDTDGPAESWLHRAEQALSRDLATPTDLAAVAAEVGMSVDGFRKRFARQAGQSPGRFRSARRVSAAANLLRETSLTHRQIAAAVGYSDEFHFTRRFRQAMGMSPRDYRRLADPPPAGAG